MSWSIVGHERAVALLQRALEHDQLGHAYLLSGPVDIGKRALALELAQAALCLGGEPAFAPCRACPSCQRFLSSNHPDLRIVELEADRVQISRQEIGRIQAEVALKPLLGARKVYVLVEVERLSDVAGNQLLKLLEEPPPGVMFVLTTADLGAVLETIVSRCQVVRMQPVPRASIEAHLTDVLGSDPDTAQMIAEVADGRAGWAIRAGADGSLLEARNRALEDLSELVRSSRLGRLLKAQELAARFTNDRHGVLDELDWWARALRDVAVAALVSGELTAVQQREGPLGALFAGAPAHVLIEAARAAQQTALLLEQNVHPRLALDVLAMDLPALSPTTP